MARPKGSKNKTTVEQEQVAQAPATPFNYEEDDAKFDSNYQLAQQGYRADPASFVNQQILQENVAVTDPENYRMVGAQRVVSQLFLVEGEVQLASRVQGRGAMVAKQFRLVNAKDENEAIQKFARYFAGLSDAQSVYTVINAAAMETIS